MMLHSVALRSQPASERPITNDSIQLNALLSALEAGKRFLDALLAFSIHEYHLISFSEWMRLPTVLMTVARLCMPINAHENAGWDVKAAQERVRLDLCLESLCYRMQQLSTYDKVKQPHPDFWYAMRFINDLTKAWYLRRIKPDLSLQPSMSANFEQAADEFPTPSSDHFNQNFATFGINSGGGSMGMAAGNDNDPFVFMKDLDFDMEQFFDMGIWDDAGYNSLGFGSH
jgi:hypothetical protein